MGLVALMSWSGDSIVVIIIMCIKIDIRKAYDSVNHDFVIHMMRSMKFPEQ